MRFGVSLGRVNPAFFVAVTEEADRLGFDSVWMSEHLVLPAAMAGSPFDVAAGEAAHPPVPPTTPVFDAAAYLAFLAALTTQIRLGTYVYLLGIRHPFVSARAFATLDILSGGRAELGIGAGWLRAEWDAVGLDFATRGRRLDETIDVCRRLWTQPEVEHHSEFFDFDAVCFEPKPIQQPIPILVGGESEPALRRAERLGDGWLGMRHTLESATPLVQRLRNARGAEFTITFGADVSSPADVESFSKLGVDRLIVSPWKRSAEAVEGLQTFSSNFLT
jgi:probable F420-dependent oxidoreductase